jgi:hypothetical protein
MMERAIANPPHSVRLRGVEGLEDPGQPVGRNAVPHVGDADPHRLLHVALRAHDDAPLPLRRIDHRVHPVQEKVEQDLLEMDPVVFARMTAQSPAAFGRQHAGGCALREQSITTWDLGSESACSPDAQLAL